MVVGPWGPKAPASCQDLTNTNAHTPSGRVSWRRLASWSQQTRADWLEIGDTWQSLLQDPFGQQVQIETDDGQLAAFASG